MSRSAIVVFLTCLFAFAAAGPAIAGHDGDTDSSLMAPVFESANATGAVNSDLAFWGTRAYAGSYDGFRIFDVSNPSSPGLLKDFECFGPQNDPVVWQNKLLFLAVDRTLTGPDCGATATVEHDDPEGWEGVRIFDVSDPANPKQIKSVYTDCGAHTITMYPKSASELLLYVSSYPLRPGPTCGPDRGPDAGNSALHEKISVIKVPTANPRAARVIAEPKISYPGDPDNTFDPDEHALPDFNDLTACHDIAVFVELRLAAAACAEQAQLWRIKKNGIPDTRRPLWVYDDNVDRDGPGGGDSAVDFWHSATFSADGKVVNFIDESFGLGCPPTTPDFMNSGAAADTGRMFFLKTENGRKLSDFTLPRKGETAPDADGNETAYCSAHLGNTVHSAKRDLLVNAWYMGGVNVIDFGNPRNPKEVAHYDAGPAGPTGSDNWSAYWYEGPGQLGDPLTVYGTDGVHNPVTGNGFQVFQAQIGADEDALPYLNPQTQEAVLGQGPSVKRQKAKRRFGSAARGRGSGLSREERRETSRRLAP